MKQMRFHNTLSFSLIVGAAIAVFAVAMSYLLAGRLGPGRADPSPNVPPTLSGSIVGLRQVVYDTRNRCEEIDSSDAPARAFRDAAGVVHLFASHFVARAMTGPDLNSLRHSCDVVYRSPLDRNPADFEYKNWLFSFYTTDGKRVAALIHSEYDGIEILGMCATPDTPTNCWWNTVTYAESSDGGYTFKVPSPPLNLVAALPYRYAIGNLSSAYGFNSPSNIITMGGFFYSLIGDWPYKLQQYGPCLIRTTNVFDPGSWRAWDGKDFTIRFADPYRQTIANPANHVCKPVYPGSTGSLVRETRSGVFITTQSVPDKRFNGPPGFYVEGSRDLIHWSKPTMVVRFSDLEAVDGPGKWIYEYESLLDPASTDRNFSTITEMPYLYFVRSDGDHPPYSTVLFRIPITLRVEGT